MNKLLEQLGLSHNGTPNSIPTEAATPQKFELIFPSSAQVGTQYWEKLWVEKVWQGPVMLWGTRTIGKEKCLIVLGKEKGGCDVASSIDNIAEKLSLLNDNCEVTYSFQS